MNEPSGHASSGTAPHATLGSAHEPAHIAEIINISLDAFIRKAKLAPALEEAVLYAALGPGKRLRPVLSWFACAACGAPGDQSIPAGIAVELVHGFSLVHDDLPALDNDDLRRGRPTLHKHAGEAMAVLAGDAMLTLAFDAAATLSPEPVALRMVRELTRATNAMIVGQVYDTLGGVPGQLSPADQLTTIHKNKTGALIAAACRMGALCVHITAPSRKATIPAPLERYADAVGLMYQAVDDLMDVTQSSDHAGKRTNKDADAGKLTYPGVFGVEGTRAKIEELRMQATAAANELGPAAAPLATLANSLASRTK